MRNFATVPVRTENSVATQECWEPEKGVRREASRAPLSYSRLSRPGPRVSARHRRGCLSSPSLGKAHERPATRNDTTGCPSPATYTRASDEVARPARSETERGTGENRTDRGERQSKRHRDGVGSVYEDMSRAVRGQMDQSRKIRQFSQLSWDSDSPSNMAQVWAILPRSISLDYSTQVYKTTRFQFLFQIISLCFVDTSFGEMG